MRRGKFSFERWQKARELAEQGYTVTAAARILGIHHSTAIYISRRMGFKWYSQKTNPRPVETVGRVERMMRLAAK